MAETERPRLFRLPSLLTLGAALFFALALIGCLEAGPSLTRWQFQIVGDPNVQIVELPRHLELPDHPVTYVLSTHFEVPAADRGAPFTLELPHLYALASLRVDGHDAVAIDPESTARYRSYGMQRFVIPGELTTHESIALELFIEHRWTQSAWFDVAPRISRGAVGDARFSFVRAANDASAIAGISTSLVCGFVYALVFVFDRRRRAEGWFAIEATLAAVYAAFNVGALQGLVGVYDTPVTNIALAGSAIAAVHFTHAQFNLGRPHPAWRWAALVSGLSVLFAGGPFAATRGSTLVTITIMSANCVLHTWYFFRFARMRPRPIGLALVTLLWPVACLLAAADFCAWLGFGEILGGLRGAGFGVALVSLSGFLTMSRDLIGTNKRIDQLNLELSGRVSLLETKHAEVRDLNDELRRQIAARSATMADMFTAATSPEAATNQVMLGDVLQDRYRIVRAIGSGGMGVVYEAERIKDGKHFALKVLNGVTSRTSLARFAREAQIVSQIDHRNVVGITDVDVSASGAMFIVMELVVGRSLEDQRQRWGDVAWALDILAQVAEGLAAIHELGIVHRDLKPGNILTQTEGSSVQAKIADFGVARLEATEIDLGSERVSTAIEGSTPSGKGGSLTQTGAMIGTPRYIAPELITGGKQARTSADVFSFGVVAFQILTRRYPFDVAPGTAFMRPRQNRPSIGKDVELRADVADLLDRCLDFDPSGRPSAHDLVAAIRASLASPTLQ